MGTKRVGWARIRSLINENANQLKMRRYEFATISTDTTLTAADAGKVLAVNGASALVVTLPRATSAGLWFRFILSDNTANVDITQGNADDDFVGSVMCLTNADTATSGDTKCRFASGTALAGDWVEVYSNGVNWLIRGQSAVNSGLIFA
tara:strand:- start:2750 stop:3196 length:447 start_codon:yes stop_codon:yes gene_type:complete